MSLLSMLSGPWQESILGGRGGHRLKRLGGKEGLLIVNNQFILCFSSSDWTASSLQIDFFCDRQESHVSRFCDAYFCYIVTLLRCLNSGNPHVNKIFPQCLKRGERNLIFLKNKRWYEISDSLLELTVSLCQKRCLPTALNFPSIYRLKSPIKAIKVISLVYCLIIVGWGKWGNIVWVMT